MSHLVSALLCLLAVLSAGCASDECLVFDYAPPSARLLLIDSATGEKICDADVTTCDGRNVFARAADCVYEVPDWADAELGSTAWLMVAGYQLKKVTFPSPQPDACGELDAPELQELELTPAATPPVGDSCEEPDGNG